MASASACSNRSVPALIRTSTAISRAGTPAAINARIRAATPVASLASSAYSVSTGRGPGGRWAASAEPDRISWLATATTCGVDR